LLDEAGLSRTSFYKYFGSKTDVLAAWFDQTIEALLAARRPGGTDGTPSRADLRTTMLALTDAYRAKLGLLAAVYETAAHDSDLRARLTSVLDGFEDRVQRHIEHGMRAGWVNQAVDPAAMAAWVVRLCESGLRHIVGPADPSALSAVICAWADVVWFTLYAPAQRLPT
jgi:AcrR family transcriptional regulator